MTVRILEGDVRERLAELPAGSVQCCVTSPPYFGLRDYGTAQWDGGNPACDHKPERQERTGRDRNGLTGSVAYVEAQEPAYRDRCGKCGAVRIDRQVGLESTLADYIETMVAVMRDVRRVLRDDGVLFLNVGDSYCGNRGNTVEKPGWDNKSAGTVGANLAVGVNKIGASGLKPKDLMMVPARLALALQADGWYLRSDIIWHKPNPMPESVADRPTSAHEHIFLLTKSRTYYYDADAIRERSLDSSLARLSQDVANQEGSHRANGGAKTNGTMRAVGSECGANARNVWTIATAAYKEAHFATFPPELPRRCILAGTSEKGACPQCGAPWVRCVERQVMVLARSDRGINHENRRQTSGTMTSPPKSETTGWQPSCTCNAGDPVPCVVLDPFAGAGTTLLVADRLGRDAVGVELNPEYARLIERRLTDDAPMFAEVETVPTMTQAPLLARVF